MRKKLLFIGTHLGYERGDGGTRKINGQVAALRNDYEVELIYPRARSGVIGKFWSLLTFQWRAIGRLRSADIIYYRISSALVILNLVLIFGKKREVVLEVNGLPSEYRNQGQYIQYVFSRYLDRLLYDRAAELVTITDEQKRWFEEDLGMRDVVVMDNGYARERPEGHPSQDLAPILAERGNQGDDLVGVMVSSFKKWHGIDRIVPLMRDLPGVRLLLVGDGPERHGIQKQVADLGLGDRVLFLGFRDLPDLEVIYRRADFGIGSFAADRVNLTGLASLKMREYLAFGLPVIVANDDRKIMGQPFVHRFVDLEGLRIFLARVRSFDRNGIVKFADDNLSWNTIMRNVMGFDRKI